MKEAVTETPIHDLIAARWSPRAFADRKVEKKTLLSLFEAARWAPSCFNEQPWSFIVATADDRENFDRLASCLVEGNAWAKKAPVLMLSLAKLTFTHNGKPNRHAYHDVGLAVENLILQAQSLDLYSHQMAGFDRGHARERLEIPATHDPVAMIAIGYRGEPDSLADKLQERELAPRKRNSLDDFVFGGVFGEAADLLEG